MKRAKLYLAPLAGVSDAPMRVMCSRMGADVCVTEMVSAEGLVRESIRTRQLLTRHPEEGPLVVQLYGGTVDTMVEAAEIVTAHGGFCGIDVNAGCPVPKVLKCGAGAALMHDPALIGRIVAGMVARTSLPITVKTRIGLHPGATTIRDVIRAVEEAGGAGLTVHGRYASAGHSGPVDVDQLSAAVAETRLPILVNGGVQTAEDAVSLLRATGAAGVMLGRGAIGNPWLFGEIKTAMDFEEVPPPILRSVEDVWGAVKAQLALAVEFHTQIRRDFPQSSWPAQTPEALAACSFRLYLFNYFKGFLGSSALRREMAGCYSLAAIQRVVDTCLFS